MAFAAANCRLAKTFRLQDPSSIEVDVITPLDNCSIRKIEEKIMKKSLLVAILLLPLAFAKASSGSQIVPLPDCYPCEPDTRSTASAARILPLPECFPCEPDSRNTVSAARILPLPECYPCEPDSRNTVSAARILPLPECYPCEPDSRDIHATTTKLITPVRGLRREA